MVAALTLTSGSLIALGITVLGGAQRGLRVGHAR